MTNVNTDLLAALNAMFESVDELLVHTGEISGIQHINDAVGQAMQKAKAAIEAAERSEAERFSDVIDAWARAEREMLQAGQPVVNVQAAIRLGEAD